MKFNRTFLASVLVAILSVASLHAQAVDTETADAAAVGQAVQEALQKASDSGLSGMSLQKAVLNLETGSVTKGGIDLNFLIFTISHTQSKGVTETTELTFANPQNAGGASKPPESLADPLAKAIAFAAATSKQVTALKIRQATISIQFVVSKDNSGKVSFEILGAKLGPNVDLSKTSKNTLTVTFGG